LKNVYNEIAARSNFPCISCLEFGVLFAEADLLDAKFTQGIMDTNSLLQESMSQRTIIKYKGRMYLTAIGLSSWSVSSALPTTNLSRNVRAFLRRV